MDKEGRFNEMKKEFKRLEDCNCSLIRRSILLTEYSNTLNCMLKDLTTVTGENSTPESTTKQIKLNILIKKLESCFNDIFKDLSEISPNLKKLFEKGYLSADLNPSAANDQK